MLQLMLLTRPRLAAAADQVANAHGDSTSQLPLKHDLAGTGKRSRGELTEAAPRAHFEKAAVAVNSQIEAVQRNLTETRQPIGKRHAEGNSNNPSSQRQPIVANARHQVGPIAKQHVEKHFKPVQPNNIKEPSHRNFSDLTNASLVPSPPTSWIVPLSFLPNIYVAPLILGSQQVLQHLLFDIGSDLTWVQTLDSDNHFPQHDPFYNPWLSTSLDVVGCEDVDSRCLLLDESIRECVNTCVFRFQYVEGSLTMGFVGEDTIIFGSLELQRVVFGHSYHTNMRFATGYAGTLGLGRGSSSIITTKGSLFGDVFSFCMPPQALQSQGYLRFGPREGGPEITWMRMLRSPADPTGYLVPLVGFRVNHHDVPLLPEDFSIDPTARHGDMVALDLKDDCPKETDKGNLEHWNTTWREEKERSKRASLIDTQSVLSKKMQMTTTRDAEDIQIGTSSFEQTHIKAAKSFVAIASHLESSVFILGVVLLWEFQMKPYKRLINLAQEPIARDGDCRSKTSPTFMQPISIVPKSSKDKPSTNGRAMHRS
ncbi:hypothetical protein L7F22_039598 [Adiantum nelumboides]|nr:hypothetical protein [Adiantum nelumboides]